MLTGIQQTFGIKVKQFCYSVPFECSVSVLVVEVVRSINRGLLPWEISQSNIVSSVCE